MLKAKKLKGFAVIFLLIGFGMYISLWVLHPHIQSVHGTKMESPTAGEITSIEALSASMDNLKSTLKEMESSLGKSKSSAPSLSPVNEVITSEMENLRNHQHFKENVEIMRVTALKDPVPKVTFDQVTSLDHKQTLNDIDRIDVRQPINMERKILQLVSLNKPTEASTRGNLGPVSVVVNENVQDWLKDRWQAAKNMQGEPIPGEHWVTIDLEQDYVVRKVVIDWEQAYSDQWTLLGRASEYEEWKPIAIGMDSFTSTRDKMHVVQEVVFAALNDNEIIDDPNHQLRGNRQQRLMQAIATPIRQVKLLIHRPSTRWGSSIWRFQVWGY